MKNQIERAEPSRGALAAAPHEPDAFEAAWLDYNKAGVAGGWEKVAFVGGFGRGFKAGRESGHVVLLEALRQLTEDFFPKTCKHNGEPWYCDSCRFEWEKEFALRKVLTEAAIKQAERT